MDVSSSEASNLTTAMTDFSVDTKSTDGPTDQKEVTWMNEKYSQYLGYYYDIPEVEGVVDIKASWACGSGFDAEPNVKLITDGIRGNGKDSFTSILENMDRTREIGGDSYAEKIGTEDKIVEGLYTFGGELTNLKPLDPMVMRHVTNNKGMLIRFEQTSKIQGKHTKKFDIDKIFYLPRNRVADEVHGNTMITRLASIILARNEAMADIRTVYHRFVKPRWIIQLDTDNKIKIAAEKRKWDKANEDGENMYIPMGSVKVEQMAIAPNSTLNPLTWIENQNTYFYESAQVPRIVVGGSGGFTDAAVKIAYLGFEGNTKKRQLYIEDQVGLQLGLKIKLIIPASLLNDMLSGQQKESELVAAQPNDTTAEMEGKK